MPDDMFDDPEAAEFDPSTGETAGEGFEPPPFEGGDTDSMDADPDALMAEVDSETIQIKEEIERRIAAFSEDQPLQVAAASARDAGANEANIVGVGIGEDDSTDEMVSDPGSASLEVYVVERMDDSQFRSLVSSAVGVSASSIDGAPVRQVVTGVIDAQPHRMRLRPAPCGISVGHKDITAGTIGCLVVGRRAPRDRRQMILSNNHVLANSNRGRIKDCITQPGPFDGGRCPRDQIATLEKFEPINFRGGTNFVDCATGHAWPKRVDRNLMYIHRGVVRRFRVGRSPGRARPGMAVGKSGRTTQLTSGRVTAVGVTIRVNFGSAGVALFRDQIAIRSPRGNFSAGGDSGSLIWTWNKRRTPVGLLFAGGGGTTFANRIDRVLKTLDVTLYT